MDVVVVESPAKAKTINRYLGSGYTVLASYGHVRDLPTKDGSVRPDQDFSMVWEVDPKANRRLAAIAEAVAGADHLYLATDPDREGEAISWHIHEVLKSRRRLNDVEVKRIVFHEVTKNAVLDALKHPRDLDGELIEAYLARRALDYLVGFTISPILWRKLPGARSAGRVQSVALRLVCEREAEIEAFKPREYWTVEANFASPRGEAVGARLTHLEGKKLGKFDLADEAAAKRAASAIEAGDFTVAEVERKRTRRRPQPPFTTSTLQQEASRKLGFGVSRTMRVAQRLYEGIDADGETVGLITYMRTDSVNVAKEAVTACRKLIGERFGDAYLPASPRLYRSSAKNAQEAHEAIRPTDVSRTPERVARWLDNDGRRLYELIWKRMVASGMEDAQIDQVAADIATGDRAVQMRATGSSIAFDGFYRLYREGRDDPAEDEKGERRLPALSKGEPLIRREVLPEQHFTQPPPRFTEASLVKKLEELGIGRPSTYASTLSVLKERSYVRLEKSRFIPEDRGRLVTAFLTSFFDRYVQVNFTADLEQRLDQISEGKLAWKAVLREFWEAFSRAADDIRELRLTQVIDAINEVLGPHFFPQTEEGRDPRACPSCTDGRLRIMLGRHGAFIGCSNYPECAYTRPLAIDGLATAEMELPKALGVDPDSGKPVTLRKGPYGFYVQLGEAPSKDAGNGKEGKEKGRRRAAPAAKPKRASLPKETDLASIDLELALRLLSLPREIGTHPETKNPIEAGIGRYGPYLKHQGAYVSLPKDEDVLTIGLNRAVVLLAQAKGKSGPLRELGSHPQDGKPVAVYRGRFGPYVKHGRTNAPIPKGRDPETITLAEALDLIAARAARAKPRKAPAKARGKPKKTPAAKG
jgi:DNA topoisomerase-1